MGAVLLMLFVANGGASSRGEPELSLTIGASADLFRGVDPANLKPLRDYLEGAGVRLQGTLLPDAAALAERLVTGEIDIGVFAPVDYVRAHERFPALVPFVTHVVNGMRYMQGYIIVRADSRIRTLADLRGKRFAYTEPGAFGGHLFPRYALARLGLDSKGFFSKTVMTGDYLESLRLVYRGVVDGAGVLDEVLRLGEALDIPHRAFRVLAKSPRVPYIAYVARPGLPAETLQALRAVLRGKRFKRLYVRATGLRPPRPRALARMASRREAKWIVNGFISCSDEDFDEVRRMLRLVDQSGHPAGAR